MREIKFRVWDNSWKRMRTPRMGGYWINGCGNVVSEDLNRTIEKNRNSYRSLLPSIELELYEKGRFALMQFIGHKDRNGKDIYEGDVVRKWNRLHQFDNGMPVPTKSDTVEREFVLYDIRQCSIFEASDMRYYEVIGNVHENPELLK